MNTENILKLAAFLEALPPENFDMNYWFFDHGTRSQLRAGQGRFDREVFSPEAAVGCGICACIGGWTEIVFPRSDGVEHLTAVREALDLKLGQTSALCYPDFRPENGPAKAAPDRAARVLRHLAATGEVDWSIQ